MSAHRAARHPRSRHPGRLGEDGTVLRVAVVNPLDPNVIDNLRFATNKDVMIYVAPAAQP